MEVREAQRMSVGVMRGTLLPEELMTVSRIRGADGKSPWRLSINTMSLPAFRNSTRGRSLPCCKMESRCLAGQLKEERND